MASDLDADCLQLRIYELVLNGKWCQKPSGLLMDFGTIKHITISLLEGWLEGIKYRLCNNPVLQVWDGRAFGSEETSAREGGGNGCSSFTEEKENKLFSQESALSRMGWA